MELMDQNFIKINNRFFYNKEGKAGDMFKRIGTDGFTIICYLIMLQNNLPAARTNIKDILDFTGIKDKRTVVKRLETLQKLGTIKLNKELSKVGVNDILSIKVNEKVSKSEDNFTSISSNLFNDYIHIIGHIGWSILCLLTKLHNYNYSFEGYANPSHEHISRIIDRGITTVKKYINILSDNGLVKVEEQVPTFLFTSTKGKDIYENYPNHYIVRHRLKGKPYYLYLYEKDRNKDNNSVTELQKKAI